MDMPIEDGYLVLTLAHPIVPRPSNHGYDSEDFKVRWDFKDIKSVSIDSVALRINREHTIHTYPWHNIVEHFHVLNSQDYLDQLKTYQDQHDHNWICSGEYSAHTTPPGFYWYCGNSKDGSDPGCRASERRQLDDQDRTIEQIQKEIRELGQFFEMRDEDD